MARPDFDVMLTAGDITVVKHNRNI
ncbi:hypothetical protein DMENIID0001_076460 [Sergentomyia squamirostris]